MDAARAATRSYWISWARAFIAIGSGDGQEIVELQATGPAGSGKLCPWSIRLQSDQMCGDWLRTSARASLCTSTDQSVRGIRDIHT